MLCVCKFSQAQTVGLVLSGGGAKGYAHIGVIKALEEHGIPIDYVTGTSMGAIVGGMYAAGYSADEMIEIFKSDRFNNYYKGEIPVKYIDYFKNEKPDGSLLRVDLKRRRNKISLALPTNLIATQPMDLGFIDMFACSSAAAHDDFDNLFVPFRCIASDVHHNREKVFDSGDLGTAIRASMTYPMLFKPVEIDSTIYFDGGIYNNFPIETMQEVFKPDIIIGVYVTSVINRPVPDADDLFAQIENLVVGEQKPVEVGNDKGIIISFKFKDVSVMDFQKLDYVSNVGYETCNEKIDSILQIVKRRISPEEIAEKRKAYRDSLPELKFNDIIIDGKLKSSEREYVEQTLNLERIKKHNSYKPLDFNAVESEYYKLISDYQIDLATPLAVYNDTTKDFDLKLKIKKDNRLTLGFGAAISSGSSSMASISASYKLLGRVSALFKTNFYYGKFYTSFMLGGRLDIPTYQPIAIELSGAINRYDFFKGSSRVLTMTYQPPYVIDYENNIRLDLSTPINRHSLAKIGFAVGDYKYSYFQISTYQPSDTSDITQFSYYSTHLAYEFNTLNYIMYPNDGKNFIADLRHVMGTETNIPGTTTSLDDIYKWHHSWIQLNLIADSYTRVFKHLTIGVFGQLFVSNRALFRNYTSSILTAHAFAPVMNSRTMILTNYRSNNYFAIGLKPIYNITNRLNLRGEFYFYMPFQKILKKEQSANVYIPTYAEKFTYNYLMASLALIYNTRVGPLGISVNYLDDDNVDWYFMFHLGFMLFNKRGLDY